MSNPIWKTPKESPRQEQLVAWVDKKGMHAGRFDTCYNCFCACASYFVDLRKVKRWCSLENLDDLIAQADKAERLQKAVDFLSGHLRDVLQLDEYGHIKLGEITKQQIKTAISDPVGIIMQLEQESNN